ncbi:nitrilase-related carbon-nitrogen hydrolase [Streptomyces sp. NPDC097107]|uniref:nitrilase-related carbon-nitrogen hydrolase n=1 Tax=Streptomyces sp. NPDC097107 TaxID=3366089 RepID=UPI00382F1EFA
MSVTLRVKQAPVGRASEARPEPSLISAGSLGSDFPRVWHAGSRSNTSIGRLGGMMAYEASFPENARGLALGGCEIAYRNSYPLPGVASDAFDIQNRARALDNLMERVDFFGGHATVTDHTGRTVGRLDHGGVASFVTATIDLPACPASTTHHRRVDEPARPPSASQRHFRQPGW